MAVVLVGPPGAGKSTVGRLLAARLGTRHLDTDAMVEAQAGMSISDLFVSEGEPAFRARESAAVAQALSTTESHPGSEPVVSVGGGAVLDPVTRELLTAHTVVWLQVDLPSAAARVGLNTARPLLLGNVRQTLGRLMDERAPLYTQVATVLVDTSGRGPSDIVEEIAQALEAVA